MHTRSYPPGGYEGQVDEDCRQGLRHRLESGGLW